LFVVFRLVDVDHGVQAGVERGQHRVILQGGHVQPRHHALLEQERGPEPFLFYQALRHRGEAGPVGGGQRLRVAAGDGQPHVRALVHRAQHPADEGGMQERHVGGADEGRVGVVYESAEPGGQALHRALALARVVYHLHVTRQLGKLLAFGADHDHGAAGRPREDADGAAQQRRPVPLQGRLGRAHP